jgi:hypothetical protein
MTQPQFDVLVSAAVPCPRCGCRCEEDIRLLFGCQSGQRYRLGGRLTWPEGPAATPSGRPTDGNLDSQGFTSCGRCGLEFSVTVHVRSDILVAVEPNRDPRPYLED